jgi:hypothetical protein
VTANANQPKSAIVILADRDKREMDDDIRARLPNTGKTRSSAGPARRWTSTISRSPGSDVTGDRHPLARDRRPRRRRHQDDARGDQSSAPSAEPYHIVAEPTTRTNSTRRTSRRRRGWLIVSGDLIARITAQTCPGRPVDGLHRLLDFDGDEIYYARAPSSLADVGEAPRSRTPRHRHPARRRRRD